MMKNKWLKRTVIGGIALIIFWGVLRLTGILQFYNIPTSGNSPAINPGDQIIATNLSSYDRLDFVCYNQTNPKYPSGVWVRRICGMPGDEILIKNGTLFVNGKNVDQSISVMHDYYVSSQVANKLKDEISWPNCDSMTDSCRISIIDNKVANYMQAVRHINNERGVTHNQFNMDWTLDNFGPLVVPKGSLFLLGDNRHNSIDSRMTGLIPEDEVVGVVIN